MYGELVPDLRNGCLFIFGWFKNIFLFSKFTFENIALVNIVPSKIMKVFGDRNDDFISRMAHLKVPHLLSNVQKLLFFTA